MQGYSGRLTGKEGINMAETKTALFNLTKMDSIKVLDEVFQI